MNISPGENTFDGEKWVANSQDDGATELPAGDEVIDLMTVSPGSVLLLYYSSAN